MISYKIFVIYHDRIEMDYFANADLSHFCFVNVNPANQHRYPELPGLNLFELPRFIPLGKWYTESEVIYNIYKHAELREGLDYIGFIHYDIDFRPVTPDFLETHLGRYELINFQPYSLREDFDQRILMDPDQPDTLRGPGRNCYVPIFEDFNSFYGTQYDYNQFMSAEINLCSCFLIEHQRFLQMMDFAAAIIESKKLDAFDSTHRHRIHGGFMERYYAVWCLLKITDIFSLRLPHEFLQTRRNEPLLQKIKSFLLTWTR
jgi:hypothetical protein